MRIQTRIRHSGRNGSYVWLRPDAVLAVSDQRRGRDLGGHKYYLCPLPTAICKLILFLLQAVSSDSQPTEPDQFHIPSLIFMVLRNLGEMVVLFSFRAYIPTLICIIAFQLAENAWIARVTDKKFPFLTDASAGKISPEQKKALKDNVKSLFLYKISGTITSSTDNILISKFQGLASVGLYSNYVYIVDVIRTFLSYIFYSMTASIGNYNATESKEANEKMFYNLFFASFWLYGFTGICLGVLLNPFIALWI